MVDRLAQQFGMDCAWWEGLTDLMLEEEQEEAHRDGDWDDAGSCSARAMSISSGGSPMALSSQVSQASPCPDHTEQEQGAELELSATASVTEGEMEGNERRAEAEALRPLSSAIRVAFWSPESFRVLSGSPATVYVKRPAASVDRRSLYSSFVIVSLACLLACLCHP